MQIAIGHRIDGIRATTGQQHILASRGIPGEKEGYRATRLRLSLAEVDGTGINARRSSGFEAAHLQAERTQRIGDAQSRTLACASAGLGFLADDQATIDKSTCS